MFIRRPFYFPDMPQGADEGVVEQVKKIKGNRREKGKFFPEYFTAPADD